MAINRVEPPPVGDEQEVPAIPIEVDNSNLPRCYFPKGFIFGSGTSAFQVEGAAAVGGKSISAWDAITKEKPWLIEDGSNGNVAADMYHRFEEDIKKMKAMGLDAYRFSISWPRILPGGRCSGGVSREGIDYYNRLIDTIIANDMKPFVTLYHWDHPNCLDFEYGGFLSKNMVDDFVEYCEVCFWEFGDRVKWWATLNEPWSVVVHGYITGIYPPGNTSTRAESLRNLPAYRSHPTVSPVVATTLNRRFYELMRDSRFNQAKDPYTVAKNMLLCHATAVQSYRTKFQPFQKGQIGIVLCCHMFVPLDELSADDVAAKKRAFDFMLGWFLEPVLYGRYPESMTEFVPPENLPSFTSTEAKMLKGSIDFLGLNYYTANYVSYDPETQQEPGYSKDMKIKYQPDRDGVLIGVRSTGSDWLYVCPWGMHDILAFIKDNYPGLPYIIVTENGYPENNDYTKTALQACGDYDTRAKYHQDHLANILRAISNEKVDVRGYFIWSWVDNFEWGQGYKARFGINYVDFINYQTRYPKDSAIWFANFLKGTIPATLSLEPHSAKRQVVSSEENEPRKRVKAAGK